MTCGYGGWYTCSPTHICGDQRTTWSQFCPSTRQIAGRVQVVRLSDKRLSLQFISLVTVTAIHLIRSRRCSIFHDKAAYNQSKKYKCLWNSFNKCLVHCGYRRQIFDNVIIYLNVVVLEIFPQETRVHSQQTVVCHAADHCTNASCVSTRCVCVYVCVASQFYPLLQKLREDNILFISLFIFKPIESLYSLAGNHIT